MKKHLSTSIKLSCKFNSVLGSDKFLYIFVRSDRLATIIIKMKNFIKINDFDVIIVQDVEVLGKLTNRLSRRASNARRNKFMNNQGI